MLPSNALFINGVRRDLSGNTFNIYEVLDDVKTEIRQVNKQYALSLPSAYIRAAVSAAAKEVEGGGGGEGGDPVSSQFGPITRIDVSKGAKTVVSFLNNIEKDAMYRSWPKSLDTLLYPSWSLSTVRRNLYTIIAVIDPFTYEGASLMAEMMELRDQSYPLRFGYVFSCSGSRADFCTLFALAKAQYGSFAGFSFAMAVAQEAAEMAMQQSIAAKAGKDALGQKLVGGGEGGGGEEEGGVGESEDEAGYESGYGMGYNGEYGSGGGMGGEPIVIHPATLSSEQLLEIYDLAMQSEELLKSADPGKSSNPKEAAKAKLSEANTYTPNSRGSGSDKALTSTPTQSDSAVLSFASASSSYISARGLTKNSFSLNGIVVNDHSMVWNTIRFFLFLNYIYIYIYIYKLTTFYIFFRLKTS